MLTQLFGAVVRAGVLVVVIATPSLLLPGTTMEGAQVTMLVALGLAFFVGSEYASASPAIIAFRDAPPVNRIRILALFLTLICLCTLVLYEGYSTTGLILNALGLMVGQLLELPFSPLQLLLGQMPDDLPAAAVAELQIMAGVAMFIAAVVACGFALLVRLHAWPNRDLPFNVWINMPTFDPTTGGDVVSRLKRDGAFNLLLALVAPFLLALGVGVVSRQMGWSVIGSPHAMVWGVSLWMVLPLSLFMRGFAMLRVAEIIRARRDSMYAGLHVDAPKHLA